MAEASSPLSPAQVELIRESFNRLDPDPLVAERFYEHLFRHDRAGDAIHVDPAGDRPAP